MTSAPTFCQIVTFCVGAFWWHAMHVLPSARAC
jgi:hypothetical protein